MNARSSPQLHEQQLLAVGLASGDITGWLGGLAVSHFGNAGDPKRFNTEARSAGLPSSRP